MLVAASASTQSNFVKSQEPKVVDIMYQLFLGEKACCPASSYRETVYTKLWYLGFGYHQLVKKCPNVSGLLLHQ